MKNLLEELIGRDQVRLGTSECPSCHSNEVRPASNHVYPILCDCPDLHRAGRLRAKPRIRASKHQLQLPHLRGLPGLPLTRWSRATSAPPAGARRSRSSTEARTFQQGASPVPETLSGAGTIASQRSGKDGVIDRPTHVAVAHIARLRTVLFIFRLERGKAVIHVDRISRLRHAR